MVGLTTTKQMFLISVVPMFQILFENSDDKIYYKVFKEHQSSK